MNPTFYGRLKSYWKPLLFMALATFVLVTAIQMSAAKNRWTEVLNNNVQGTKGRNAAIGAAGGGVAGGIAGFLMGGVGIVLCGTGIGIPAGAMLIGGAALGAGAGAAAGAATGTSSYSYQTYIQHVEPAYQTWQWAGLLVIAFALFVVALYEHKKCVSVRVRVSP